jgi:hypothetical protein
MVTFSAGRDASLGILRVWRVGPDFFPAALETLDGSAGLRIERAVLRFPLRPLLFEDSLGGDASEAVRFRSSLNQDPLTWL